MSAKERLVYGIIKFLADEAASDATGEEAKESIEGIGSITAVHLITNYSFVM